MKRTLIASFLATAVAVAFGAGDALAQAKPGTAPKAAPAAAKDGKKPAKNYAFDADLLEGDLVRPSGEFASARKFSEHGSLIKVRVDFIKEIVKSAEDL
jgi:hypothetical protein